MGSPPFPYRAEIVASNTYYTSKPGDKLNVGHPAEEAEVCVSRPTLIQMWFSNLRSNDDCKKVGMLCKTCIKQDVIMC